MKRREFIKNSICLGCAGMLGYGAFRFCSDNDFLGKDEKISPFIFKSKNDLPTKVTMDFSTICSLKCPRCWQRTLSDADKQKENYGYLKFDDFKKFVDKNNIKSIQIYSSGEIFDNPDFDRIIEYAHSKHIQLYASGGAHLNNLSEKTAENIVKCGLEILTVSIDGATPETYSIYRVGGDFNKVIENVKKINKYKKKYNTDLPELRYKFIVFGHNEHEIQKAKELAKELNMKIVFTSNYAHEYSPLKNPEKVKKETGIVDNNIENDFNMYLNGNDWFWCLMLRDAPLISINGEFYPCCMTTSQYNRHLNVFKDGMYKVLNSEKIINIKETLSDFSKPPKDSICANCVVYTFLKNKNYPLKFV